MRYSDLEPASIDPVWSTLGPEGKPGKDGRDGADGRDGVDGRDGADGLGLSLRGLWWDSSIYDPGDVVTHNHASFVCRKRHSGKRPSELSPFWQLLAGRGERGPAGVGQRGRPGETVVVGEEAAPFEVEFAAPVAIGEPVYIQTDGLANLAKADDAEAATVVGFRVAGGVVAEGRVTLSGLKPGAVYYLAAGGGITTEAPTQIGLWVVPVGRALSSTVLDIEIGQSVAL